MNCTTLDYHIRQKLVIKKKHYLLWAKIACYMEMFTVTIVYTCCILRYITRVHISITDKYIYINVIKNKRSELFGKISVCKTTTTKKH